MAYFHSPEQARSVVPKLKALRAAGVSVDRIGEFRGDGVSETINPLTGDFRSLSYLTLTAETLSKNDRILAAASVDASGLSAGQPEDYMGDFDGTDRRNILLTAVVDERNYEHALRVVHEAGGRA
ncbi:hypothetical protein CBW46_002845 [Paenibacillus xerothermodurans]|uniref:Uncharacterized protein n=1 Tax=Paenibacillus xerothermodurans TaxID=1977292 RepID=A0A2W1NFX8_PAEXE|nr:hypothetical protein CBW46_002845 [Paenibacillus xerothermodurans]